jgi:hypothetical protein
MMLIKARTTKLHMQIIGVRDFFLIQQYIILNYHQNFLKTEKISYIFFFYRNTLDIMQPACNKGYYPRNLNLRHGSYACTIIIPYTRVQYDNFSRTYRFYHFHCQNSFITSF